MKKTRYWRGATLIVAATLSSACASAPRGPAPLIEQNGETLSTVVSAPLDRAAEWTTTAFHELGILLKEVEVDPNQRRYMGTDDSLSVSAALHRETQSMTRVEVTAHDGAALEPQYAHKVIERIVRQQF